jgi:hypothetical protein
MPINTSERRRRQRLNRLSRNVINALAAGATLHFMHTESGPRWRLFPGRAVSSDVAKLVIAHASVIGDGDALLPDAHAQTFRQVRESTHTGTPGGAGINKSRLSKGGQYGR